MEEHSVEEDANEINTTLLELQDAFAAALREAGVMGKLRAQVRAAAVSVIRGDSHLRTAALEEIMLPSAMSLECRIALLLIEEFTRSHGLKHTAGVFEMESNLCMVSDGDRAALQHLKDTGKVSTLEALIADALGSRRASEAEAPPPLPPPPPPSSSSSLPTQQQQQQQQQQQLPGDAAEALRVLHHLGLSAALKEYEDSVGFSDASLADSSQLDDFVYEHVDRF